MSPITLIISLNSLRPGSLSNTKMGYAVLCLDVEAKLVFYIQHSLYLGMDVRTRSPPEDGKLTTLLPDKSCRTYPMLTEFTMLTFTLLGIIFDFFSSLHYCELYKTFSINIKTGH